jgi:carboxyl-terminal processing protease
MKRFILLILFLIISINWNCISQNSEIDKTIEYQAQKFKYILETAAKNHPDSLDIIKISDKAFEALLQSMDKESYYYSKSVLKKVQENHKGISYGVGVETVSIRDSVYVIQLFPATPAAEAGIGVGDQIVGVDGKKTLGFTKSQVDELIEGDSATKVKLTIKDCITDKKREIILIRRDILKPSLTSAYFFPLSDIGVFTINRFSETTADEFREKAVLFLSLGMKRLLIDVRGNPGGYMNKVDEILDMLIGGNLILTKAVSGNPENNIQYYSKNGDFLEKIPVVVLIDENSASGSELLAGVIQDYDRGIVVGKLSYGKGSVQKIWSMNDSSGFKLTIGKYYTPSGRDIQKYPISENIVLEKGLDDVESVTEFENNLKKVGLINDAKILRSSSGRPIISVGGVLPDEIVKADTLTQLTHLLIRTGLYFEWAISYKKRFGKELIEKYGNNYTKFNVEFQINDDMLKEFANFALTNKVWNIDMFNQDKSYFINYMKASIANVLWGFNAFQEVLSITDKQVVKAVLQFPIAEKMIN